MRRDLELIHMMVLAIEDHPSGWAPHQLAIDGYSDEQIGYHAYGLTPDWPKARTRPTREVDHPSLW